MDRLATAEFAIPSIVLMENAAIRIAEFAAGLLAGGPAGLPGGAVLVFCGPGNNGGDGLGVARHLAGAGIPVAIILAGSPRPESDASTNLAIARRMNLPMFEAGVHGPAGAAERGEKSLGHPALVIDALLGTGAEQPAREPVRGLILRIIELGRRGIPVLSVDIPSGLDADEGLPAGGERGIAVEAGWTVTLVGPKLGFGQPGASRYTGRVAIADIGIPPALAARLGERVGASGTGEEGSYHPPEGASPAGGIHDRADGAVADPDP
jgi:hydroxyethylthiazole kinase-like uncharacterized protein yjeF